MPITSITAWYREFKSVPAAKQTDKILTDASDLLASIETFKNGGSVGFGGGTVISNASIYGAFYVILHEFIERRMPEVGTAQSDPSQSAYNATYEEQYVVLRRFKQIVAEMREIDKTYEFRWNNREKNYNREFSSAPVTVDTRARSASGPDVGSPAAGAGLTPTPARRRSVVETLWTGIGLSPVAAAKPAVSSDYEQALDYAKKILLRSLAYTNTALVDSSIVDPICTEEDFRTWNEVIYLAAFYIKPLSRLSATQDNQARAVLTSLAAVLGMAGYESPLTRVMLSEVDVNAADKGEKINKLLSASQQALFKIHQNMQQRISAASQAGARPASAGPTLQRGDSFREIIGIADPESAAPAPAAAGVLPGNPVTVPAPVSPGLTSAPAQ